MCQALRRGEDDARARRWRRAPPSPPRPRAPSALFICAASTPASVELVGLVLHQRDQWRHDDRRAGEMQRRQLVAQRLAGAGGHDRERVRAPQHVGDHFLLARPQLADAEGVAAACASATRDRRDARSRARDVEGSDAAAQRRPWRLTGICTNLERVADGAPRRSRADARVASASRRREDRRRRRRGSRPPRAPARAGRRTRCRLHLPRRTSGRPPGSNRVRRRPARPCRCDRSRCRDPRRRCPDPRWRRAPSSSGSDVVPRANGKPSSWLRPRLPAMSLPESLESLGPSAPVPCPLPTSGLLFARLVQRALRHAPPLLPTGATQAVCHARFKRATLGGSAEKPRPL